MVGSPFDGLEPVRLWRHFEALSRTPRCSKNEERAAALVLDWAKARDFEASQDVAGNVIVRVPARGAPAGGDVVVLQGHLDMVGEKDADSPHDFATDPIPVVLEGEHLTARGTTLGADNGIGVAAAMAVAEDEDAVHGPLELLLTIDEETGLTGAQALAPEALEGRVLLNLDSEEEGVIYVGCAGGADTRIVLPLARAEVAGEPARLRVHGLRGGHSGLDINAGRGNALALLGELLGRLRERSGFALVEFAGGDKHNAIPREAEAVVLLPAGGRAIAEALCVEMLSDLKARFGKTDPGAAACVEPVAAQGPPLTKTSRDVLLDLLLALPHGVLAMSQEVAGLVETSTNLAVVRTEADRALLEESSRSSVRQALAAVQEGLFAIARLAGAEAVSKGAYPGWQPDLDSRLLALARAVHTRVLGREAEVKAIHAGLECGLIGEKFPGMKMISIGPEIDSPHSPSESVHVGSVGRFYGFLKALLAELATA